jgi:hypothetical protein
MLDKHSSFFASVTKNKSFMMSRPGAAKGSSGRVEMISFAPFGQLDDGPEALLLGDDDDSRI